jgi:hypothetical protein
MSLWKKETPEDDLVWVKICRGNDDVLMMYKQQYKQHIFIVRSQLIKCMKYNT